MQKVAHNASTLQQRAISCVLLCLCVQRLPRDTTLLEKALAACQVDLSFTPLDQSSNIQSTVLTARFLESDNFSN
jgi:hypothetical protein